MRLVYQANIKGTLTEVIEPNGNDSNDNNSLVAHPMPEETICDPDAHKSSTKGGVLNKIRDKLKNDEGHVVSNQLAVEG